MKHDDLVTERIYILWICGLILFSGSGMWMSGLRGVEHRGRGCALRFLASLLARLKERFRCTKAKIKSVPIRPRHLAPAPQGKAPHCDLLPRLKAVFCLVINQKSKLIRVQSVRPGSLMRTESAG